MAQLQPQPGFQPPPSTTGALHEGAAPVVATPADVPGPFETGVPFWMPGWSESMRYLGWRWIYIVGLAALGALLVWATFFRGRFFVLSFSALIIHGAAFTVGGAISMVIYMRKGAIKFRKDPFCIHCGYSLTGLPDHATCPECGRLYSFRVAAEYKRDPHWFIERYRNRAHSAPAGAVLEVRRPSSGP